VRLHAAAALLPEGWRNDVAIEVDASGAIANVTVEAVPGAGSERVAGYVVPGMPNAHSHAFQRAMAGLAERRTRADDSFWTWRELMYRFAGRITPAQMRDIAAYAYVEMLKAGYTSVAEFHYLHHDVDGRPYQDPAEMSQRILDAAAEAGIAITHLPVAYAYGGFGARAPQPRQARFVQSAERFSRLFASLHGASRGRRDVRIGLAIHSLRAVDPAMLASILEAAAAIDPAAPIHIHVAEQQQEVEDCVRWSGRRPVQWLLENAPVDERWCAIHATHLDANEIAGLARSGATVGLCPTTEANLGDGIFPAASFFAAAGGARFAIGSDSHVWIGVAEELRLLEYGQRLRRLKRPVLASEERSSPGERLYAEAAIGGARALGLRAGEIAPGRRADLVVLDPESRALWNLAPSEALDAWIFAGDNVCVRSVMVGGEWRIRDRRHAREEALASRYRAAQLALVR
jgi:formimidoylglutamate deiminase